MHAVHARCRRGVGVLDALHGRVHQGPVPVHLLRVGHPHPRGVETAVLVAHAERLAAGLARAEPEELQEPLPEPATSGRETGGRGEKWSAMNDVSKHKGMGK